LGFVISRSSACLKEIGNRECVVIVKRLLHQPNVQMSFIALNTGNRRAMQIQYGPLSG